jgi:hypothetical protein
VDVAGVLPPQADDGEPAERDAGEDDEGGDAVG